MELNSVMGLDTVGAGSAAEGIQEVAPWVRFLL